MKRYAWMGWIILFVGVLIFGIWFRMAAPCSWMGNLPAKEIPGRCLTFVRH